MTELTITGLYFYPIKACAGVSVPVAPLDPQGIRFDRRWMLTDPEGTFLTQREYPGLTRLVPSATEEALTLAATGLPPLTLPLLPDAALVRRTVTVWSFTGEALDEGDAAAGWLTEAVGTPCRLVRTPDDFSRRVSPKYANPDDRVGFADAAPLTLASEASLADLNARLTEAGAAPVPMSRFRPNVVVSGSDLAPWDEDAWRSLATPDGRLTFRVPKPAARCAVVTIDQATGEKTGPEPLATLARFRRTADGKVNFAVYLLPDRHGLDATLRVGDGLRALP